MRIDLHVIFENDPDTERKLDRILAALASITTKENTIMATLKDIQDDVASETTVVDSVVTLLESLSAQLTAAIAANDPVALQGIVDNITANKTKLASAVAQNTPAAPPGNPPATPITGA